MKSLFLAIAALFGMLSVGLGAFATHALRGHLEPRMLEVFQTGVQYQIYHALALGGLAILLHWYPDSRLLSGAGWAFVAGVLLFSGSLYMLAISGIGILGAITPIGGLAFMLGWLLIFVFALRI